MHRSVWIGRRWRRAQAPQHPVQHLQLGTIEGRALQTSAQGFERQIAVLVAVVAAVCEGAVQCSQPVCEGLPRSAGAHARAWPRIKDRHSHFIADQLHRRGQIQGTDSRGNAQVVDAFVPLANMFGYVNQLRSFTQGRAQYTMQFSHYDEVPANVAAEVKEKLA